MAEEKPDRITIAEGNKPSSGVGRVLRRLSRDHDGDGPFIAGRSLSKDAESAYYDEGSLDT
jgi:hypothetical protein